MEQLRFGNSDLMVSAIGLGCYGMSGVYGPADDTESIATIGRALDLGVNFLDTSASYGNGHNHRLIGAAIKGRRQEVVIHSKSGSPRDGSGGGGDAHYLRETCETSLRNLGIETLDVFCLSRIDPNVPVEDSVAAMAALVKEGKTRFIALSECSAEIAAPRQRGASAGVAADGILALVARRGRAGTDRRVQNTGSGDDGLCRARPRPYQRRAAAAGKPRRG